MSVKSRAVEHGKERWKIQLQNQLDRRVALKPAALRASATRPRSPTDSSPRAAIRCFDVVGVGLQIAGHHHDVAAAGQVEGFAHGAAQKGQCLRMDPNHSAEVFRTGPPPPSLPALSGSQTTITISLVRSLTSRRMILTSLPARRSHSSPARRWSPTRSGPVGVIDHQASIGRSGLDSQ